MFWFGRPPYLRRFAAGALLVAALLIEFWPQQEALYPFAAVDIAPGDPITVEWRRLPSGAYERPILDGVAAHALARGEPISASDVVPQIGVPDGWWALALEVPSRLAPGDDARLVLAAAPERPVAGIVIQSTEPDRFAAGGPTALIAVPADRAGEVATAASQRQIVVLVAP